MTDPVPAAVAVKVTEQLPVDNVQLVGLNEPPVKVNANVTVPVGVIAVPAAEVSVTVALTVAVQLVAGEIMLQLTFGTDVLVVRGFTVTLAGVALALLL